MNKFLLVFAFLFISCSSQKQVVLRVNRGDCLRVEKISKDIELIMIDCKAPQDTILTIKNVAVRFNGPGNVRKIDIDTLYVDTIILKRASRITPMKSVLVPMVKLDCKYEK